MQNLPLLSITETHTRQLSLYPRSPHVLVAWHVVEWAVVEDVAVEGLHGQVVVANEDSGKCAVVKSQDGPMFPLTFQSLAQEAKNNYYYLCRSMILS